MRTPVFLAETVFSGPRQEQAAHHTGADAGPSQIAGADARSVRFADAETEDALERQADKLSEEPRSLFFSAAGYFEMPRPRFPTREEWSPA